MDALPAVAPLGVDAFGVEPRDPLCECTRALLFPFVGVDGLAAPRSVHPKCSVIEALRSVKGLCFVLRFLYDSHLSDAYHWMLDTHRTCSSSANRPEPSYGTEESER